MGKPEEEKFFKAAVYIGGIKSLYGRMPPEKIPGGILLPPPLWEILPCVFMWRRRKYSVFSGIAVFSRCPGALPLLRLKWFFGFLHYGIKLRYALHKLRVCAAELRFQFEPKAEKSCSPSPSPFVTALPFACSNEYILRTVLRLRVNLRSHIEFAIETLNFSRSATLLLYGRYVLLPCIFAVTHVFA